MSEGCRIYPEIPLGETRADDTQSAIADRLARALSREWSVFCNVVIPVVDADDTEDNLIEVDFAIAHPGHGILLVDIKAGQLFFSSSRKSWLRRLENGAEAVVADPLENAELACRRLATLLASDTALKAYSLVVAPALVLFNDHDKPEYKEKTLAKSVMGREGGLDEFQHAVDYLMSSHYVTGRVLPMDGGRHLR